MWHPCNFQSCPECVGGQCFGGGCRTNPMPEPKDNDNNTQEEN